MAEQAERVILEADDAPVLAAVRRANAALDSHGNKYEAVGGKIIRVNDGTRNSVQRVIASVEKMADVYGKSGVDRLIAQRDQLLQRYSREPAAIEAVTRAYGRMITAQKGIDAEMGKTSRWQSFGQGVRNFVSAPLQSAETAATGLATKLGPVGIGIAAVATALVGAVAAGYSAAKSLGEYGVQIKDVELRTGMTAKEVGQFSFAARAVGQDVSIYERTMRGLSQALGEDSVEGEKARAMIGRLHLTMYDANTGGMKPTAQVLQEIGRALAALPAGFERDAAALALFKRAGIEAVPAMVELSKNLAIARKEGYGPSEEQEERFLRYQAVVAKTAETWARYWRNLKEGIVNSVVGRMFFPEPTQLGPAPGYTRMPHLMGHPTAAPPGLTGAEQAAVEAALSADTQSGTMRAAEAALKKTQTQLKDLQEIGAPWEKLGPLSEEAEREKGEIQGIKDAAEAAKKALEDLNRFRSAAAEFERRGDESEMDAVSKIYYQRDLLLKQAQKLKGVEADIAEIRRAADVQAGAVFDKGWGKYRAEQLKQAEQTGEHMLGILPGLGKPTAEQVEMAAAQQRVADLELRARREMIQRAGNRALRVAELSGAPEAEAIRTAYQIRIQLALELAAIEQERIDRETDSGKKLEGQALAKAAVEKEAAEAAEEAQLKQLEMLHKQSEEIKGTAAGLFHTLFTKPADFGRELAGTLKEAMLRPVTEGLGTITANVLHPLIFGATGEGGVAGMFRGMFGGGRLNDVKLINGAMPVMVMNGGPGAGGQGTASEGGFSPASWAGFGRTAVTGLLAGGLALGAGMPAVRTGEIIGGGSSTAGLTQLASGLWNRGGGTEASMAAGGSPGTMARGLNLGTLRNLKGSFWNEDINLGVGNTRAASSMGLKGDLAGVLTSQGGAAVEMAAGMPLAMAGISGSRRGSWGGIAESAGGGALMGAGIGTMILPGIGTAVGAGIGAVAGFGIGVGEKIAGVESAQAEARRLVKQIYGIDIPQSNSVIKQIVEMAQSQYGGSISMTVRTPAVRDLLQLYAESTGQKSNLWLSHGHGVNLTEANGMLNQSAVYNNGTPYTYASNLPILGPAGSPIPTGNPFAGGVTVQVSAEQTENLWTRGTAAAIAGGSRAVAASAVNGQAASASRISGANVMLSPDTLAF